MKAHAKINLFLHVVGKRQDGYHLLESLVSFADNLFDELFIEESDKNSVEVIGGDFAKDLIGEENNIIIQVLDLYPSDRKFKIKLIKNIPVGAGLGGGSADAAATFRLLEEIHGASSNHLDIMKKWGDTMPCYYSKPLYFRGIGDIINPIIEMPKTYVVLVNPLIHISTPEVFKIGVKEFSSPVNMPNKFGSESDFFSFLKDKTNDLYAPALTIEPALKNIVEFLNKEKDCHIANLSGSGATCFGLFDNEESAKNATKNVKEEFDFWVKTSSLSCS